MPVWSSVPVRRIHPSVASLVFSVQAHDCHVAGGYARWATSPRDDTPLPKDIDIICPSPQRLQGLRASFKANGLEEIRDGEYSVTFRAQFTDREIQLLKLFTGHTVEACLAQFDLSVCRVALLSHDAAIGDHDGLLDEQAGRVRVSYVDPERATNTMCRLLRYANKGYDIDRSEVEKILTIIKDRAVAEATKPADPARMVEAYSGSAYGFGS